MAPTAQSGCTTAERRTIEQKATMSLRAVPGTDAARGQRLPRSARRAQLLEAAQAAFVESGYHAAAMDDIADRAGVSKPVLYQHFPGKLELYLALLDKHSEALEQLVREALASTTDNKERVYATIAAYFDFVSRDGAAFRLIFESDLTNESAVRNRLDAVGLVCAEAVAEVIAEDTGLTDQDASLLGMALTGLAQVSARHWLAQGSDVPKDEAALLMGALAWRGLGSFPKVGGEGSSDTAG
jgi:AcrR family transcriptional regulator